MKVDAAAKYTWMARSGIPGHWLAGLAWLAWSFVQNVKAAFGAAGDRPKAAWEKGWRFLRYGDNYRIRLYCPACQRDRRNWSTHESSETDRRNFELWEDGHVPTR